MSFSAECPRPVCHGVGTVLEVRRCSNGAKRRRLECRDCGHRWTAHQGQPPGHRGGLQQGQRLPFTRLTEAEVRAILTATGGAKQIAAQVGRSHPTVLAVLSGTRYADRAPELPRRSSRSCLNCGHWSGRCGLGFPDPEIEGPTFGADCPSWCDGV